MAAQDCIDEIRKIAGDLLDDQDAEFLVREIERRQKARLAGDETLSPTQAFEQVSEDVAADISRAAKLEKRNKFLNTLARRRIGEFLDRAENAGLRPDKALSALNVGTERAFEGSRLSAGARSNGLFADFFGGLVHDLEKAGLLEFLTRRKGVLGREEGVLDREIAEAMWSIGDDGKATANVSREAREIGEIIARHQESVRVAINDAGGAIGKMKGYIVRQSHNQTQIRRAGLDTWKSTILPLLDAERTFKGADVDKFLDGVYDGLSTGIHLSSERGAGNDLGFRGPGNLAKKLSSERVLHFKDGASWFEYNQSFGGRSLIESVVSGFRKSSQDIAVMQVWGTNPRAMFDATFTKLREKHRGNRKFSDKLRTNRMDNEFKDVAGEARRVQNITLHNVASTLLGVSRWAKLGQAVISSVVDLPAAASELRWQGQNLGNAYTGLLAGVLEGRKAPEQKQLLAAIGVGLDDFRGTTVSRISAEDSIPGSIAKIDRLFFKLNLLTQWTERNKQSVGKMMAHELAGQQKTAWGDLNPRLKSALSDYGFDEPKWEVIRQAETRAVDGRNYLTSDAIEALPDSVFAPIAKTPRQIRLAKNDIARQLTAYYVDRADVAVPTAGPRQRQFFNRGRAPGTVTGTAVRFVSQFLTFPITFTQRVLGRELRGYNLSEALLQGKGDLLGLAHVVAASTAMGMVALQTKEVLKGRSPRDPFGDKWAKTWAAAFLQGGGLGLYGDFLIAEYSRFGRSVSGTLVGPVLGDAGAAIELVSQALRGEDVSGQAIQFTKNNTPFLNLFYTRAAMDYLIFYQLQEMASPGYLRRLEKRIKKNNDQTFILPPSQAIPRGGGDKLFEGVR